MSKMEWNFEFARFLVTVSGCVVFLWIFPYRKLFDEVGESGTEVVKKLKLVKRNAF